jgi:NAD(P)H dehydrogenase (quinone)
VNLIMRSVIVLAHPEENSFNARMANLAKQTLTEGKRASADILDLYRMRFEPVERAEHYASRQNADLFDVQAEQLHASETGSLATDVKQHVEAIEQADLLILQYPMWWYTPPAILKGWLDRVFVYGRTYSSRCRYDTGFFRGKRAMLSVTTGGPEATFKYNGRNGDIDHLLWPLNFTLYYLGFEVLDPFVAFGVYAAWQASSDEQRAARLTRYLQQYQDVLRTLKARRAMTFNTWSDWDEQGRLKPGVAGFSPFMRAEP